MDFKQDIYQVVLRPVVTEKTSALTRKGTERRGGSFTFEVHPDANKSQIRDAIEKIYNVKVQKVRTQNRRGKVRRFRFMYGRTPMHKRAVVVLDPNSHIDLF
jgi:large subunit ribosomal protein L23